MLLNPRDLPDCTLVKLPREIDISNSLQLYEEAVRVVGERAGRLRVLVFDLTETTFIDSRGVAFIAATGGRARQRGAALRLVVTEPQVARVLMLTGLRRDVPVYASLAEAATGRPWEIPGPRGTGSRDPEPEGPEPEGCGGSLSLGDAQEPES